MLGLLSSLTSVVFWIRSVDYQKQLYVSEGYESLWGYSTGTLYDQPAQWFDTLVPGESGNKTDWFEKRADNDYTGTALFQIKRSDGRLCWIKDQSCLLVDQHNQKSAIIGVGEYLSDEQMNQLRSNPKINQINPHFSNFSQMLCHEYLSTLQSNSDPTRNQEENQSVEESGKYIQCNGQQIWLSRREYHVLELLYKGLSAKQTAWELGISVRTVETYLNSLRKKTGCRTKLSLLGQLVIKK